MTADRSAFPLCAPLKRIRRALAVGMVCLLSAGCDDGTYLYMFDATVTDKSFRRDTAEPLIVMMTVTMNDQGPHDIECRLKNALRPMWEGLSIGQKIQFTKTSTFEYRVSTICGLLNDAKVIEIIK